LLATKLYCKYLDERYFLNFDIKISYYFVDNSSKTYASYLILLRWDIIVFYFVLSAIDKFCVSEHLKELIILVNEIWPNDRFWKQFSNKKRSWRIIHDFIFNYFLEFNILNRSGTFLYVFDVKSWILKKR